MTTYTLSLQVLQRQPMDPAPLPANTVVLSAAGYDDDHPTDRAFHDDAGAVLLRVDRDTILDQREHRGEELAVADL